MKKLFSLFSVILLSTSLIITASEEAQETNTCPRYSIAKTAKQAWENKWVKVGAAAVTCASLYTLGVKYNLIALPSCVCAAKVVVDQNNAQQEEQTPTNNVDTKEEQASPLSEQTTQEENNTSVADNSANEQVEPTTEQAVTKENTNNMPILRSYFEDAKKELGIFGQKFAQFGKNLPQAFKNDNALKRYQNDLENGN